MYVCTCMCLWFDLTQLWELIKQCLQGCCLPVRCGSFEAYTAGSWERKMKVKGRKSKDQLEPMTLSLMDPMRTDWNLSQILNSSLGPLTWCWKAKENPGEGGEIAGLLWPHINKVSKQISYNACELQNNSCFTFALRISCKNVSCDEPNQKQTGKRNLRNVGQINQVDTWQSHQSPTPVIDWFTQLFISLKSWTSSWAFQLFT